MEFTPELLAFQGVIISADSVQPFSKLTARGGNEEKIEYVVECIRKYLLKESFITERGIVSDSIKHMRKLAFYIVINSDLQALKEMVELDGIDALIWTIPTIPICLMCEFIWKLHMAQFINEIIIFSCPKLALETEYAVISNFKYFNPTSCLEELRSMTGACYKFLCRLNFYNIGNDIIDNASTNFLKCLKYFIELPNSHKINILSEDDLYKFMGTRLHAIMSLLHEVFIQYTSTLELKQSDFEGIYESTFKEDIGLKNINSVNLQECKNKLLQECIENCHTALLDTSSKLTMEISVDIFCAWSEFEENGITMQQTIGELCYKVHNTLTAIQSVSEHPLLVMLQHISCKPVDLLEVINETDSATIIEKINNNDEKSIHWLKALVYRDQLCNDAILVNLIAANLKMLNDVEHHKLFKVIYNYLKDDNRNDESLKLLCIRLFSLCKINIKQDVVEEHFVNQLFNNKLETQEFNNMMTEIFNKLILSPDEDLSDILTVFIQCPKKVLVKICILATENVHQTDIMLKAMLYLEKYSNHYYSEETESTIIAITKETIDNFLDADSQQINFIKFINGLKAANIISSAKLLLLLIMPNLHSGLLKNDINQIYIHCKLLLDTYTLDELIDYRTPMLAMLAQILDVVRWKINTFVELAPTTLNLALQLQASIMDTYNYDIPEKESLWLKCKLKNIKPLNMYYYRQLWNPPGSTFVEIISGTQIHKRTDIERLQLWLSQVLCSTILQEWYEIWDSLMIFGNSNVFNIFHNAMVLIITAEKSNRTNMTEACLINCLRNHILTIRYRFLKPPLNHQQVSIVMNKLVAIENLIEECDSEEVATILLPIFSFIAERKSDYSIDVANNIHKKLKHKPIKEMANKVFVKEK